MNRSTDQPKSSAISFGWEDALFILFRHKWKIIVLTVLGLIASGLYLYLQPSVYYSQAKLLVRYVVDTSTIESLDSQARTSTVSNDNAINTEIEILRSWDLAAQIAETIPPEKLLPKAKKTASRLDAARAVAAGLSVASSSGTKVIWVTFEHSDPDIASLVLSELIKRYLEMHLEVHRPSGGFEFLTQQSDQMRLRLNQTEEQLKSLKTQSGIFSVPESMAALTAQIAKQQQEMASAEAELAAENAQMADLQKSLSLSTDISIKSDLAQPVPEVVRNYHSILAQIADLEKARFDLSGKYAPESRQIKLNEQLLANLRQQCAKLEHDHPVLVTSGTSTQEMGKNPALFDLLSIKSRIAALEAKAKVLKEQEKESQAKLEKLSEVAVQISQLDRQKRAEEENGRYFDASLEKARIDETLNPAKMPNINVVQKPSPATKKTLNDTKMAEKIAASGLILGLGLALLKELVLDKTVKRARDIEVRASLPLTMTIPYLQDTRAPDNEAFPTQPQVAPWEPEHFMRTYCDAIRDRLELYFQLLTHKPKLLAVVGLSEGAGTSTLAAGLASALSRTAEGKVLYVDMNSFQTNLHSFLEGRPSLPLDVAFNLDNPLESAAHNLYLAKGTVFSDANDQPMLKRFYNLLPLMKGSDYDYIVFDLPPLTATNPSRGLIGFMDRTLMVVEAEKDTQSAVQRLCNELNKRRFNVSLVLNKVHPCLPDWAA